MTKIIKKTNKIKPKRRKKIKVTKLDGTKVDKNKPKLTKKTKMTKVNPKMTKLRTFDTFEEKF